MMKEDMLDSSSDDDDVEDYKESNAEYDNLGAIEEAEQEDSDNDTEEGSIDDKGTDIDDEYGGFAFVQDLLCSMQVKLAIPKIWILLDSQSTVDVFSNPKLLFQHA